MADVQEAKYCTPELGETSLATSSKTERQLRLADLTRQKAEIEEQLRVCEETADAAKKASELPKVVPAFPKLALMKKEEPVAVDVAAFQPAGEGMADSCDFGVPPELLAAREDARAEKAALDASILECEAALALQKKEKPVAAPVSNMESILATEARDTAPVPVAVPNLPTRGPPDAAPKETTVTATATQVEPVALVLKDRLRERLQNIFGIEQAAVTVPPAGASARAAAEKTFFADQLKRKEELRAVIRGDKAHMEKSVALPKEDLSFSSFAESYIGVLNASGIRINISRGSVKLLDTLFTGLLLEVLDRAFKLAYARPGSGRDEYGFSPLTPYPSSTREGGSPRATVAAKQIVDAFIDRAHLRDRAASEFTDTVRDAIRAWKSDGVDPIFPIDALDDAMLDYDVNVHVSSRAVIALAAGLQYVASVVLTLASSRPAARKKNKDILESDIQFAIASMRKQFYGMSFPSLRLDA